MGLGKTCMSIAAVEKLMDQGRINSPVLVIALSSLKYQWAKEIIKFSDSNPLVVDGTRKQREEQYAKAKDWRKEKIHYIIVNYEAVVNDWDDIKSLELSGIICDEATAIKSFRSKRSKKVKDLGKSVSIRFALTGTPVENGRPEEVFSIMQFVNSKVLGRFDIFDETFIVRNHFGGVQRYKNLPILHRKLKDVTVRKAQTDPDVAPYLPATTHREPLLIPLHRTARTIYRKISSDLVDELIEAQDLFGTGFSVASHYGLEKSTFSPEDALRGSIMSKVTALKMLCDHPKLTVISANKFLNNTGSGNEYLATALSSEDLDKLSKAGSTKVDTLVQYVKDHLESDPDAKVVVFTSYVDMIDIIREAVPYNSSPYTGKMNAKEKEDAKTKFQTDPDTRVLVSSDAGGYGVDLPQANLLINYDLPWSSGAAVQRNSRIKRASSRWPSIVIQDLLAEGTIEERQYDMLQQKSAIASAVIDGKGANADGEFDLTVGSLLKFLQDVRP
jgi:SNF2 family DNA or RNA helicase